MLAGSSNSPLLTEPGSVGSSDPKSFSNLIRDKRTHELNTMIETGSQEGMIDFNRCLVEKVNKGEITIENAYLYSNNPRALEKML